MNCDGCECYVNTGPTMVPYQEGWVSAGDDWECGKGLEPEDCDPDDHHNTVRSHGLSEQDWERGDYERDRDEGRRR